MVRNVRWAEPKVSRTFDENVFWGGDKGGKDINGDVGPLGIRGPEPVGHDALVLARVVIRHVFQPELGGHLSPFAVKRMGTVRHAAFGVTSAGTRAKVQSLRVHLPAEGHLLGGSGGSAAKEAQAAPLESYLCLRLLDDVGLGEVVTGVAFVGDSLDLPKK